MVKPVNYKITEEKKFELVEELKHLQEVELKEIADRLERARNEDLSEEVIELGKALEERDVVEQRIAVVSDILDNAEIINDKNYCDPSVIMLGSSVKLKQGDRIFDIKIVSSLEADPEKNLISDTSPLGKALLESKLGDTVNVSIRGKSTKYKILDVC